MLFTIYFSNTDTKNNMEPVSMNSSKVTSKFHSGISIKDKMNYTRN